MSGAAGAKNGATMLCDLLPSVERRFCLEQRTQTGKLAELWREAVGPDAGELVRREGDSVIVRVESASLRQELAGFRQAEMLATLARRPEFQGIRRLRFVAE